MTRDEADELLAQAIRQHAEAYEICDPDELLSSYVVVANWQPFEADGHSRYTLAFERAEVPNHIARGLLPEGLVWLDSDGED